MCLKTRTFGVISCPEEGEKKVWMEMVYGGVRVAGSWNCAGLCVSSPRLWTLGFEWKQMPFLWANSSPMPTVTLRTDQVLYLRLWSDNGLEDSCRGVFVYLFIYLFIYVLFMNVCNHLSFFFWRKQKILPLWHLSGCNANVCICDALDFWIMACKQD